MSCLPALILRKSQHDVHKKMSGRWIRSFGKLKLSAVLRMKRIWKQKFHAACLEDGRAVNLPYRVGALHDDVCALL